MDHGKTSLIKALTGVDCDTHPEEKRRGITINNGYASLAFDDVNIGFIDVPGHHRYIKQMVAGASGIDFFLLVVAADDGVMPQTIEHLKILKLYGISRGVVAITKIDAVDEELRSLVQIDLIEELKKHFDQLPLIHFVSSVSGQGVEELKNSLVGFAKEKNDCTFPDFKMFIDRSFSVKGIGTVVTGTMLGGELFVGKKIYLNGKDILVKALQVHGSSVQTVTGKKRVAIQLGSVGVTDVGRGDFLSSFSFEPKSLIDCQIRVENIDSLFKEKKTAQALFFIGAIEVVCKIRMLESFDAISNARDKLFVQVELTKKVPVFFGDRFILRNSSNEETLGGGVVLDTAPLVHRKFSLELIESLAGRAEGNLEKIIESEIEKYQMPVSIKQLLQQFSINLEELKAGLSDSKAVSLVGDSLIGKRVLGQYKDRVVEVISKYNRENFALEEGLSLNSINAITEVESLTTLLVEMLLSEGVIRKSKISGFNLSVHSPQLTKEQVVYLDEITKDAELKLIDDSLMEKVLGKRDEKQLLSYMIENKIVKKIGDSYIDKIKLELARVKLVKFLEDNGEISVANARDIWNSNRKSSVAILEYFDSVNLTKRVGDARILE